MERRWLDLEGQLGSWVQALGRGQKTHENEGEQGRKERHRANAHGPGDLVNRGVLRILGQEIEAHVGNQSDGNGGAGQ